jgi:hypothetical protein
MSTTTKQFNDWADKLLAWTTSEAGELGNKNLSAFCNATNPALSAEDRLKLIASTPDILALAVTENKKVVVLHSIKNMGGTLIRPNNKVVALLGTSHDVKPVVLNLDSALKTYKARASKFEDIKTKLTREELEEAETLPRVSNQCAHLSGIIIPPPFKAKMILETAKESEEEELDPIELVEKALFAGRAFDTKHEGDEEYNEGGLEKSEQLIR